MHPFSSRVSACPLSHSEQDDTQIAVLLYRIYSRCSRMCAHVYTSQTICLPMRALVLVLSDVMSTGCWANGVQCSAAYSIQPASQPPYRSACSLDALLIAVLSIDGWLAVSQSLQPKECQSTVWRILTLLVVIIVCAYTYTIYILLGAHSSCGRCPRERALRHNSIQHTIHRYRNPVKSSSASSALSC